MPLTLKKWEQSLHSPAMCSLLPVRDLLDNVMVRTSGAFVAGYEAAGIPSFFHGEDTRNTTKDNQEALIRSLPERSMRLQVRYELTEGCGDLPDRYKSELMVDNPVLKMLDRQRIGLWREREKRGLYLKRHLHYYFIWDPLIHHQSPEYQFSKKRTQQSLSLSTNKCIDRTRREHESLLSEFESLMAGLEPSLDATGTHPRRLSDHELFLELQRAANPLATAMYPYRHDLGYESARSQAISAAIEDEREDYFRMGGLLYSLITLKNPPDATFPGIMRELMKLEFPLVVTTDIIIPDQTKITNYYKRQLLRMQAAQKDMKGNYKINVEAIVAEKQLIHTIEQIVSSSLKVCELNLTVAVRTSEVVRNDRHLEEQQNVLADRRSKVLTAMQRMNGARALPETIAQKRMFVHTLPGCADPAKRERQLLTLHAADLLGNEMPWSGLPERPTILLETPFRQLIPFSPFASVLTNGNILITGESGSGKTFDTQMLMLSLARTNAMVSILERGDSYTPLVELNGGRVIEVNLDGGETLNPFDLPSGERMPNKEKIGFLKNLTRFMIGDSPSSDPALVDGLLSEAIERVYKRCANRRTNQTPTYRDLRDELSTWEDQDRLQRVLDEAHLAAMKLRRWTDQGVYAQLFDRHTSIRTDNNFLFFNVEKLNDEPMLATAMSMVIARAMSDRASGRTGQQSITVLDECWALLDSPVLAPEVVQLFRTARKRNSSVWGISQALEDFVGTATEPRPHGAGIIKNTHIKFIGSQSGDLGVLEKQIFLNEVALNAIKRLGTPKKGQHGEMLLVIGEKAETTQVVRFVPTPLDIWICSTYPRERIYREWFLRAHADRILAENYRDLATRFPRGLASLAPLPEELSGEVHRAVLAAA